MTGFADIFKKSFLQNFTSGDITVTYVAGIMALTCMLAVYLFFVYRFVTKKTFYSRTFAITVAALSIVTASVILTVQSNIVISLGMVGALSIVRFRTAVKDPMDLLFLFWSIANGITCGAGMVEIAVVSSLALTVFILILDRVPIGKAPRILVVEAVGAGCEKEIVKTIEKYCKYYKIKSRNMNAQHLNLVAELRIKEEYELLQEINGLAVVENVSLLSHDGEVTF